MKKRIRRRWGAPWTIAETKLLGKKPDSVLAHRWGRTIKEVVAERERRRIGLPTGPRRWTMREIQLLGRFNDYEVARRLKRDPYRVRAQRIVLGIPPLNPWKGKKWTRAEEKRLGTARDSDLAAQFGRTVHATKLHRARLRIPIFESICRKWAPQEDALLGTMRDEEVAARTGHPLSGVTQRRYALHIPLAVRQKRLWTPDEDRLLGTLPDLDLAALLKHPLKSVRARRQKLRRPPFRSGAVTGKSSASGRVHFGESNPWTDHEESLLGKMADRLLARKIGRARSAVTMRRRKLGIPVFNSRRRRWTPEDERILGARTDIEAALLLRTTVKAVRHRRAKLNLPPSPRQLLNQKRRSWTGEENEIVRTHSPTDAARLLNRSRAAIIGRRRVLGICQITRHKWTRDQDALFPQMNDKEIAAKLGRTTSSVENRRVRLKIPVPKPGWRFFSPEEDALLGTASDAKIAERLGRHPASVQARRLKLGIYLKKRHGPRRPWTAEEQALLGTDSDTNIAVRIGRAVATVCIRRQKLGIPNFYWQKRCGQQRRFRKQEK